MAIDECIRLSVMVNKPDTVTFTDGRKLVYTYSAGGSKLTQELYQHYLTTNA